ncbi:MAG: hypothetical protein DRI90_10935 [Deltaproteobacteria bacterium]|nr:MAG: hypothetical protein DRI90_10935 [Deltaproteobacteria bacterium]
MRTAVVAGWLALATGVVVPLVGCDGSECTAGRQTSCACSGGQVGIQTCSPDGTYGACDCGGAGGSTSTSSSSSSSSGQGGTGGSPCDPPRKLCGGDCIDVTSSTDHCGNCDQPCPATALCEDSACYCPGNQVECGGVCLDVQSDDSNCGGCAHDCLGGTCTNGLCPNDTLAGGQNDPRSLVVDANNVYWTIGNPSNSVYRVPLTGGTPVLVVGAQIFPRELALDNGVLYWSNYGLSPAKNGSIQSYTLPNTGPVAVASALDYGVWGIAVQGDYVYWANQNTNAIYRESISTPNTPQVLTSAQGQPWDVAVDSSAVYWTNYTSGDIRRMGLGGGSQHVLATAQGGPLGIAVDATHVYWSNNTANQIRRVPVGGGTAETVISALDDPSLVDDPSYVALDSTHVYWTNYGNGTVCKAPLGGGHVTVLAAGQNEPYYIAVDATHAYWTTLSGGTVRRVPK